MRVLFSLILMILVFGYFSVPVRAMSSMTRGKYGLGWVSVIDFDKSMNKKAEGKVENIKEKVVEVRSADKIVSKRKYTVPRKSAEMKKEEIIKTEVKSEEIVAGKLRSVSGRLVDKLAGYVLAYFSFIEMILKGSMMKFKDFYAPILCKT